MKFVRLIEICLLENHTDVPRYTFISCVYYSHWSETRDSLPPMILKFGPEYDTGMVKNIGRIGIKL